MPEPLLTPRLSLREFSLADFDALREIDADPEVLRWRARPIITPAMTRDFLAQAANVEPPRQQYAFAIILSAQDRLIGQCGLTIVSQAYDEAFLWYSLNRRDWGQGYASEAAGRLLRFGFEAAGLRRIFAECEPANTASARVMEKIGLKPEPPASTSLGRLRAALSAADWQAGR